MNQRFGRVLIFIYGFMALAAGARAGFQLATKYSEAPVAYLLSALAAVIYIVATACLVKATETARWIAVACVSFELVFVIVVGILSISDKSAFPDATVWSDFGIGYGFAPVILPIVGLWWLLKGSRNAPPNES